MIDPELLDSLATRIASRMTPGRVLRIGIDGRCGSGKTTLANQLAQVLRARGIETLRRPGDDYHNPSGLRYRQGEFSAQGYYEDAFDYSAIRRAVAEAAHPGSVLLFEGMFLFRAELNDCWDYRILIDADAATCIHRAVERDTGVLGPRELMLRKYTERYEPAWLIYLDRERPRGKADAVVGNPS